MKYSYCFLLLWCFGSWAQELPPIQNFYPSDYHGENQNWAISQSSEKLIYVANSKGLLEFNGASWKLYPSPNETIMRSVKVVDDRIYTGCFMEFGYWKKTALGVLAYTSLSKNKAINLIEDEEFWTIINVDEYVVFQSLKRIYIYSVSNGEITTIDSNEEITKMYELDGSIYFQRMGKGIFKIESGRDFSIFEDAIVQNDEVIHIFGSEKNPLLLTKRNGFYTLQNGSFIKSDQFPNEFLSTLSLYTGLRLRDNSFVLGSISNGLIHLDANGELRYQIDQERGLSNNTVLALFEDVDNTIWLGLDHGISYININAPYKVFNDTKGILGSVYAAATFEGKLYLGTNQGLFYQELNSTDGFRFIRGTQGQVWCLKVIGETLFCGHHSGTFEVTDARAVKISEIQGAWNIAELESNPNLLLQGNYDGLYVLERSDTSWSLRNKIKGFHNSSKYFETLARQVFVSHEYNGVFTLELDDSFFEVTAVTIDTLIKGSNSGIAKYEGEILYAYKEGVFKYDQTNNSFLRDSILSSVYAKDEYESGKLIVSEEDNKLWIFNKSNISFIAPVGLTNTTRVKSIPWTKEVRDGILGYENVTKLDDDGTYLLGKTSGYITFNINEIEAKEFQLTLGSVYNGANNSEETLQDKEIKGTFGSEENNFHFSFYAPEYNRYLATRYQYRLQGIYETWSDWSENPEVFYENLPPGTYTFEVRAKIGNTISKNTPSYAFKITKPWYISTAMVVVYLLGILLFSVFMHNVYKQYYKKQRQKLIDKNQRELQLAQVQNEREIIKIKNERLELENKAKSKELAASTMSIIKKNELLTMIKEELDTIGNKDLVKPVIKIIDKSLRQNDDWELFQEAFNNADSEFLKNIKQRHPKLSPNDLKLCAYLRLNLSSKEIAQLLHISPRSVEIKRYRLRKKLNLKHEDNLVNYILGV